MEEQVSHISDLEGLNSELEGFLADLHGREESMSARVKILEDELAGARNSAAAAMARLTQKEASLSSALEELRASLAQENSKVVSISSERDELSRRLQVASGMLEDSKTAYLEKEAVFRDARLKARNKADELAAALEESRSSLNKENAKASALAAEKETLARQLEALLVRLEESKAAALEKENSLREARAAAKEESAKFSAGIEGLQGSLLNESSRVAVLAAERDGLIRQVEDISARLKEAKAATAEKDELFKEVRTLAKQDAAKAAAAAEELRASLNNESSRASALGTERETLLRQITVISDRLEEAKASAAEKEGFLKEARASAKQDAVKAAADAEELRAALNKESSRASSLSLERDDLARRLQALNELLDEAKAVLAEKDALMKEARAAAKEKAAELSAVIDQLRSSLEGEGAKVSAMASERDGLLARLKESASLLEEEKETSLKKDVLLDDTCAAAKAKAAELSAAIDQLKASLFEENSKVEALVIERDGLLRKLELEARSLEAEKARSLERELLINGARSAFRDKEKEIEKLLQGAEELKADLALERANVKDREAQLQKALKMTEAVERRLELSAQENTRSEEGYLLKVELVKKELREQVKRTGEVERKLAAAGARLEDTLDEVGKKEKMLAEACAALAEKDAQLKDADLRMKELTKQFSEVKSGSGHESIQRARELTASMAARVEELENAMSEAAARSLEKFRASQAELSGARTALRVKEEENVGLKARENSLLGELSDAEEKWKLASAQLYNAVSRLRNAENENEIALDRLKFVEEERNKFRAASGAPGYIPDFEELVAGVAHQVANSISIIRSHAEFCAETPEAEGARESLNVIVRNIVNLQKKIDIIMNFSKPVIPQRSPEKLTAVLSEVLDSLRSSGRLGNIKVSLKGGEKLAPVSLDRVRFASAVEQLLVNAVDAMPGGGELSVSLFGDGGRQRLEIADTGVGVEKKNLSAVFHPFFTTRPGKMGLGLTLARNVARAHGGTLELLNDPGKGARAVLELPEA